MRYIYGYNFNSETQKYEINAVEAEVVALIFQMYIRGFSQTAIAKKLNLEKVLLPQNRFKWHKELIIDILRDESYIGSEIEVIRHVEEHPPIISDSLFYKSQEIADRRAGYSDNFGKLVWEKKLYKGDE